MDKSTSNVGEEAMDKNTIQIDVRGPYVTPELNNELQCNVGNMWEKFT